MNKKDLYNRIVFADELSSSIGRIEEFFRDRRPEKRVGVQKSFDPDLPGCFTPRRGVCICITPRSGSTALSTLISETSKAKGRFLGYPAEFFNLGDNVLGARARHYGCQSFDEYVSKVLVESTDEGETFAVKGDFSQLFPVLSSASFQRFAGQTTYVYLYRRDVVAQAVSLARAHKHGVWNSSNGFQASFDLDETDIANWATLIVSMEAAWTLWFSINRIEPIRIAYEDVMASPYHAISQIYEQVHGSLEDFPLLRPSKEQVTRNQSSAVAGERFRARFRVGLEA